MSVGTVSSLPRETVAQEAQETRAETKAEAAGGDQQAQRKLAAQQAAQAAQDQSAAKPGKPAVHPEGKGSKLNTYA